MTYRWLCTARWYMNVDQLWHIQYRSWTEIHLQLIDGHHAVRLLSSRMVDHDSSNMAVIKWDEAQEKGVFVITFWTRWIISDKCRCRNQVRTFWLTKKEIYSEIYLWKLCIRITVVGHWFAVTLYVILRMVLRLKASRVIWSPRMGMP